MTCVKDLAIVKDELQHLLGGLAKGGCMSARASSLRISAPASTRHGTEISANWCGLMALPLVEDFGMARAFA